MIRKEISKPNLILFVKRNQPRAPKKYACQEMQPIKLFENFLLLFK